MWYHVAEPNTYLVLTGAGIDGLTIKKKAFVLPFQKVTKVSVTPFDFSMNLQAMTIEKLKFSLPAVFTIGPENTPESLEKYAVLLTGGSDGTPASVAKNSVAETTSRNHIQDIVKGIIEGETRSIVSTMTMEELFRERKIFKAKVLESVQSELEQFGLRIYNANVKELQDTPGSEYFDSLSRKAHEGALNQAKVDVADARMRGEVGEAEKKGKAKQEVAKINAQTAVLETERKAEKAQADAGLADKNITIERDLNLARIEAKRAAEARDAVLQKDLEQKRAAMELERLRATTVTKAKIEKESAQEKADADFYTQQKHADAIKYGQETDAQADLYRRTKDAEAQLIVAEKEAEALQITKEKEAEYNFYIAKRRAEADFFEQERKAEANYITRKREAEGLTELAKAYGELGQVLGGPQGLMQYFMLQNNTYEKLAHANAEAIRGLQPKINVWNTGAQGETGDPTAPIRNLFQSLPPLLSTINDQTGISPPNWLAQMPQQQVQQPPGPVVPRTKQAPTNATGVNGHK